KQRQAKAQPRKAGAEQKVAVANVTDPSTKKDRAKAGAAQKDVVIDVIVAYTRKAASNYSDVKRELVGLAIEEANESFRQSGIGHVKLRLVHAYQTDYLEDGDAHFDHVWHFAEKGDGYIDAGDALRAKDKADQGGLI